MQSAPSEHPIGRVARLDEPRVALPLLLLLAIVTRLPNLGESLWYDEVVYSIHADVHQLWGFIVGDGEPTAPLYSIVAFFWISLVGEDERLVRFPSLIAGTAEASHRSCRRRPGGRGLASDNR